VTQYFTPVLFATFTIVLFMPKKRKQNNVTYAKELSLEEYLKQLPPPPKRARPRVKDGKTCQTAYCPTKKETINFSRITLKPC
ncbi:MAG: hypothetical protein NWF06_00820, partial [Candidatus Bathyarchaeota archaeon]|nr:hypothetical protein [Candidatus Bathyarchaeum sp.]